MVSAPLVVRLPATDVDVLGHRAGADAADHRHVVGAVDGDGDELAGGAVAGDGGEAVGDRLAGAELLDRGLAVVGGVGPVAVGIEREGAVAVAAGGAGLGGEVGLALVDVGDGERAAGGQVAGDDGDVLGDRAGADAADHRHVVGAVDGDGDVLRGYAAVMVVECDGVDFVHGLVGSEGGKRAIIGRESPRDQTARAGASGVVAY